MSQTRERFDPDPDVHQRRANDRLWRSARLVRAYANRVLRPVEVLLLVLYRDALSGTVLELGCGAGRVTGYLIEIARDVHGIDVSKSMVDYCRRVYPGGTFHVGDIRDIGSLEGASFDVVVAPYNVLDVLGDADRRTVLDGIHHVLGAGGVLIMSTHNRAYAPRLKDPLKLRSLRNLSPRAFVASSIFLPGWIRNHRRARRFEREEADYAILNDISHDFLGLHYYISRDAQELQLAEHGFSLIDCFDLDGRRVEPGEAAAEYPELHYVARRSAQSGETAARAAHDEPLVLASADA